jgi:diguanylate cyclase (GGDEF)-like protein
VGLDATLAKLWREHRGEVGRRVEMLDLAVARARTGDLDADTLAQALRAGHQLKGTVGTFGFMRASELAGQLEDGLRAEPRAPDRLDELMDALREALPTDAGDDPAPADEPDPVPVEGSATVLAIDDDPFVRDTLEALLSAEGWTVSTHPDGARLLELLGETSPDLVVLDVDIPGDGGLELCRMLRADARGAVVPVLVLTSRRDPDTVRGAFAAGADDYVAKPIVGPELTARIANRLERTRLLRALAETDHLTGLVNRGAAERAIERLLRLARRHKQPLALAVVDVDRFKRINDTEGHAAGDVALRGVADALRGAFRSEDVVARWGGDEFVLALYATSAADGSARLGEALARAPVPCSHGVAVAPEDGRDLAALFASADAALYAAKHP